jgi:CHAT domain-containing protein/tetratricopeptide (TPR) repeat protein
VKLSFRHLLLVLTLTAGGELQAVPEETHGARAEREPRRASRALADTLVAHQQLDSALVVLDFLLDDARRMAGRALETDLLLARGGILATIGRAKEAEAALRPVLDYATAHQDSLKVCQSLRHLARVVGLQGRMAESSSIYRRLLDLALTRQDRVHEAHARLGLAYADLLDGRAAIARAGYDRAIALFREQQNDRFELIALTGLGRCLGALGESEKQRACFLEVAERSAAIGDPYSEGHALNNLGAIEFSVGDPAAAARYYRRAYELQIANRNLEGSIIPAKNIATALTHLGQYEDAAATLTEVLHLCEAEGYRDDEAIVLVQLGIVRRLQGRLPDAAALLRRCAMLGETVSPEWRVNGLRELAVTLAMTDSTETGLSILLDQVEPLRRRISPAMALAVDLAIGELLLELGRPDEALPRLLATEAAARRLGESNERVGLLALAGRTYASLGRPDSAMAFLLRASRLWEAERTRSRDPEWREQMGRTARLLYANLARVMLDHPADLPEDERVRATFNALQRFKARTLRERMLGPSGAVAESLASLPSAAATVDELQQRVLGERELLLDAFLGAKVSFLFAVNRHECRVARLPGLDEGLDVRLARYHDMLAHAQRGWESSGARGFIEKVAIGLGDLFLAPFADMVRDCDRVLVAPDGALSLVPLGTLVLRDPSTGKAEPLLAAHEIVQVPSATLLAELRNRSGSGTLPVAHRKVLAMAGWADSVGSRLPGAVKEVVWLERHYADVDVRREVGSEDPADLGARLAGYQLLHFAAHTSVDDSHPWRSGILLAAADGLGGDGYLRASQIATLRLPARLVVLSGCESAGGRVLSGEGVLGLTAAFSVAGVPAVVATLWPVSDRATARMMETFYRSLARGETAAAALKEAQIRLGSDRRTSHPFYWAGFVLVGNGDVCVDLVPRAGLLRKLVGIASVGLLTGLLWFGVRRRAKVVREIHQ